MHFVKMQGAGNDYVYLDRLHDPLPPDVDPAALARLVSDRHTGIGADGLIVLLPSRRADVRMAIWNADGSAAETCGNGLRCVARYLHDRGLIRGRRARIETARAVVTVDVLVSAGRVTGARLDLGPPILEARAIPTLLPGDPPLDVALPPSASDPDATFGPVRRVSAVSMGNPHCIAFVDALDDELVLGLGPRIERHPAFPQRTNVEFAVVRDRETVDVRVWERGSGETLACGTGACATVVAGVLSGRLERSARVRLPGGELAIDWSDDDHVLLTGPAVEVFRGDWPDELLPRLRAA